MRAGRGGEAFAIGSGWCGLACASSGGPVRGGGWRHGCKGHGWWCGWGEGCAVRGFSTVALQLKQYGRGRWGACAGSHGSGGGPCTRCMEALAGRLAVWNVPAAPLHRSGTCRDPAVIIEHASARCMGRGSLGARVLCSLGLKTLLGQGRTRVHAQARGCHNRQTMWPWELGWPALRNMQCFWS